MELKEFTDAYGAKADLEKFGGEVAKRYDERRGLENLVEKVKEYAKERDVQFDPAIVDYDNPFACHTGFR